MKNWTLYRFLLRFCKKEGAVHFSSFPGDRGPQGVLKNAGCLGAALTVFDAGGVREAMAYGIARMDGEDVSLNTVFRAASVSKFVTALGAMKLKEQGRLNLDTDVNEYLPFSLRHPLSPDTPITLRMLLSHTAGIHDGEAYNTGIANGATLSDLLKKDSFTTHKPHEKWEYSNFGAGIAGVVMEAATGTDFEGLMQETVFSPLGVAATYYPQKVRGPLADAIRILPRSKTPNFNAGERQKRPLPEAHVDVEKHYNLAHGNLCVSVLELTKLGIAGMEPGFLSQESLNEMRSPIAPFGERAHNLSQGVGTFILEEPQIGPRPLYGHQGMAYGAVHGLFFDPETKRGLAVLTTGASEARRGVLADLNFELLKKYVGEGEADGAGG